jgi:hypothetical protein
MAVVKARHKPQDGNAAKREVQTKLIKNKNKQQTETEAVLQAAGCYSTSASTSTSTRAVIQKNALT